MLSSLAGLQSIAKVYSYKFFLLPDNLTMQTIHLFDTPAISTHDAIIIENYGKLFWYDSKQFTQECKALGIATHRSMFTDAKQADACSTKQFDTWEKSLRQKHGNAVDGTILDIDLQSLQYEDAVNALLFGYTSDNEKQIAPNAHLASLDKPLSTYYLTRDIAKTNIRKNKKPKTKAYESNPFIWQYTKHLQASPLDIVNNIYIAQNEMILHESAQLEKNKQEYKTHKRNGNMLAKIKNKQNALHKYL